MEREGSAVMQATSGDAVPDMQVRPLKILFFPFTYVLAHVGRTVAIAKALRARGHEAVFAGELPEHPQSKLRIAREAGFRIVHVKEPNHPWAWEHFHDHGILGAAYCIARINRWAPLHEIVGDIARVTAEERPDIVVGDASIGVSTAAHIHGLPAVLVMNGYNSHFYRRDRPYRYAIKTWDMLTLARRRARVYRKYGVPPVDALSLLGAVPILSPDLEEFHPEHPEFPFWRAIGPLNVEVDSPLPPWFGELDDGTPNVYITMGSTGLLDGFLRRAYPALGGTPCRYLVTTAGQARPETIAAAPENFRFSEYAPGSKLLEHSKAMIFHGGNGSMYQALAAGVPMVALPAQLEQRLCARIPVQHGFGLCLSARHSTGTQIWAATERLMGEASFKQRAMHFQDRVRKTQATDTAARIIEEEAVRGVPAGAGL